MLWAAFAENWLAAFACACWACTELEYIRATAARRTAN